MQRTTDSEGRNVRYSIAHPMFGDLGKPRMTRPAININSTTA